MPDGYLNTKSDLLLLHLQSSTPSLLLLLISHHLVLLSTACPTSLASEPNIRGGRSGVQMAPGAVRRSEGSTTTSQRSKRDRDTEPDLIRNQDILRKISTTKNLPRSFVMGSEASERSEKNPFTTSKATQRGTVTFPSTSTSSAADALRSIFSFLSVPCGGQDHSLQEGFLLIA